MLPLPHTPGRPGSFFLGARYFQGNLLLMLAPNLGARKAAPLARPFPPLPRSRQRRRSSVRARKPHASGDFALPRPSPKL